MKMVLSEEDIPEYLFDINSFPLLNDREQRELAERIQNGDESARTLLVNHNLRLVVSIARHFQGRGVSLPDLIQEGNCELYRTAGNYDPLNDAKFSTYAGECINGKLRNIIREQKNSISVPHNLPDLQKKWNDAMSKLEEELGMPALDEEIQNELEGDLRKSKSLSDRLKKAAVVNQGIGNVHNMMSVAEYRFSNVFGAYEETPQEEVCIEKEVRQMIIDHVNRHKDQRAAHVFLSRFGLNGDPPKILGDIASTIGVSKTAVSGMIQRIRDYLIPIMIESEDFEKDLEQRNSQYQRIAV